MVRQFVAAWNLHLPFRNHSFSRQDKIESPTPQSNPPRTGQIIDFPIENFHHSTRMRRQLFPERLRDLRPARLEKQSRPTLGHPARTAGRAAHWRLGCPTPAQARGRCPGAAPSRRSPCPEDQELVTFAPSAKTARRRGCAGEGAAVRRAGAAKRFEPCGSKRFEPCGEGAPGRGGEALRALRSPGILLEPTVTRIGPRATSPGFVMCPLASWYSTFWSQLKMVNVFLDLLVDDI